MKKEIIDKCIQKAMKHKEGAQLLSMHPKAFSRLVRRYKEEGESALMPKKPGPKHFTPDNRTPEWIERLVIELGLSMPGSGPQPIADELEEQHGIRLHPTTVWRILKRNKIRYTRTYKRWKQEPTLYCLDTPGEEVQLDGCYPFGKSRQIVGFDAIDDCSRFIYGRIYTRETVENAIDFVKHLIKNAPFRIKRIRVDNRYGKKFRLFCESIGIEVIENDPYTPEQNGKIERFHKTLKREFFWRYTSYYDDIDTLQYKYLLWQHHYNYYRKHGGFGMNRQTPALKIASTMLQSLSFVPPKKVTLTLQQYTF